MTTERQQEMLEKIRALLAKAEGTKFPEEAKSFTAKAQELMAKYSIDEAMLSQGKDVVGEIERTNLWMDANEYRAPKVALLDSVARTNNCKICWGRQTYRDVDGKRKRQFMITITGFEKDRDWVVRLFTSLLLQSEQELLTPKVFNQMELECDQGGHRIKWRNSFMMAYSTEIYWILEKARMDARKLVVRKFEEFFPGCKTSKGSDAGQGMGSAGSLGRESARRADLGRGQVQRGSRGMIGGGQ